MAWTTPTTVSAGDKLTSTMWNNQVASNLNYLLSPNHSAILRNNGGDYTTTSTAFVDIDSTNLSITLQTYGGPVLVVFSAVMETTTETAAFDLAIDGTRQGASFAHGLSATTTGNGNYIGPVGFVHIVTGLAAGSHTFRPQWMRVSTTAAPVLRSNSTETPVRFWAIEL